MATFETIKERHADATRKQASAAHAARRLQLELDAELNDRRLGAPGARERAAALKQQVAAAQSEAQAATGEADIARAALKRRQDENVESADLERQRSIPALRQQCLDQAKLIDDLAMQLGALMNRHAEICRALGEAVSTMESRRALGLGGVSDRYRHCLARHFEMAERRTPTEIKLRGGMPAARWVPWLINPATAEYRMTLESKVLQLTDDLVRVFATESEGRAAQGRSKEALFLAPGSNGLFYLVAGKLRGVAARPQLAREAPAAPQAETQTELASAPARETAA